MRLLFEPLSRLPLQLLYRMSAVACFVLFRVGRWRRAIASANIARAFPDLGESARASLLRGSYRNLGEIIAEFIWSYRATPAQIAERVAIDNPELINSEIRSGRSVLLMTAHYCNWEWQVLAGNGVLDHPMYPAYKPQRLASLDRFILAARARFGGTPIPHKALTRELLRHRSEARVYAMVADQVPTIDEPKHWTRFLGQDSAFFVGADAIARVLAASVVFVEMHRVRRGHYRMRLERIAEPRYPGAATSR
jgi:KDO2-lipid IV(A) lauroyltransferase